MPILNNDLPNLYNLITDNSDEDDLTLQLINTMFDNMDAEDISKYYDLNSYNDMINSNKDSLTFLHLNTRSVKKKITCIEALIGSLACPPDVIAISESWLKPCNSKFNNLTGYTAFHITRPVKKGGGVSLLVRSYLTADLIDEFSYINENIEICTIKLKITCKSTNSTNNYIISCIYRPHGKQENVGIFDNILTDILSKDTFSKNKVILLGDFNIDLLNYMNHRPTGNFLSSMQAQNFFEVISRPTRFPPNPTHRPSLIDHIYCNFTPTCISGILTGPIADHLPTFIVLPAVKPKVNPCKIQFRIFDEHSKQKFTRALCNVSWEEVLNDNCVNKNFDKFQNILYLIYNQHFHIKTKVLNKPNESSPWITSGIIKSTKTKNKLYKLFQLNVITHERYTTFSNRLKSVIKAAKQNYYVNYFSNFNSNLKKSWETINSLTNSNKKCNKKNPTPLLVNGVVTNDSKTKANAFNSFFASVASKLDDALPPPSTDPLSYLSGNYPNSMVMTPVGLAEVMAVIKSLKNKKTSVQEFSVKIIKENSHLLAPALKILFNQSISHGIFPSKLKIATIIPLHKANSKLDQNNYRPISLLSIFSKIFEKLMMNSLSNYLNSKSIIHPSQFGFQKSKNTHLALKNFSNFLYRNLDNGNHVLSIFIDYSKAFDTVSHSILLKKLYHYGIRGNVLKWFESYLSGRTQCTLIDGVKSKYCDILSGVPQGSILGPVLFLLYINDLPNISKAFLYGLYADDSALYLAHKSPTQLINIANSELHKLYFWCTANRLSLNFSKSFFMLFSNRKIAEQLPPLVIKYSHSYQVIARVDHFKFLGVIYDDQLSFKYHSAWLTNKLSHVASMIYQVKDFLPSFVQKLLYFAHVHSLLSYCNTIWASTHYSHLQSLIRIQKRIIRLITASSYLEHK